MQKHVNLVVLVKSFLSNEYLLAKFGLDTAVNRSVSNVTIVNYLFVPLRYLQFLKLPPPPPPPRTSLVKFARSPRTDPPGVGFHRCHGAFREDGLRVLGKPRRFGVHGVRTAESVREKQRAFSGCEGVRSDEGVHPTSGLMAGAQAILPRQ